jgi:hypothetical protein
MTEDEQIAERYRRGGTEEWQARGSDIEHRRYSEPVDGRSRRRCHCGCKRRATHRGMANGICLMMGCQLRVARWVRDPFSMLAGERK